MQWHPLRPRGHGGGQDERCPNVKFKPWFCHAALWLQPQGEEQRHWIYRNKDHGKMSATASLGLVTLWDVEGGLPQIDK